MKVLGILLALTTTSLRSQNPREIVLRYLETVSHGRIENWNKIKTIYIESEVYYGQQALEHTVNFMGPDKANFHKSYRILPYNEKNEIYEDSTFTKLLSTFYFLKDKTFILLGNMTPIIKESPVRDEFYSWHLPVQISKLLDKSKAVELLRIATFPFENQHYYEIKITTKGRNYLLYINTETFLLEYWNGREDEDRSILAKFYNYRKIDDFLIPMSDCMMKDGVLFFSNDIRKYQINAEIDPRMFDYKDK